MLKAIKEEIEKRHNVTLDGLGALYTRGDIDDGYGWEPVPQEWLQEAMAAVWAQWGA